MSEQQEKTPAQRVAERVGLRSARAGLQVEGHGPNAQPQGNWGDDGEGGGRRPRTFVKGLVSSEYNLNARRDEQLASVKRVFTPTASRPGARPRLIEPGDEPYYTQSLHVHFRPIEPGSRNEGHGHQNEAMFYVLEGHGWEEHDGKEYPWEAGDAVAVNNDCVHWHCNGSQTEPGLSIVFKAKPMWLFMGLMQQGEIGYKPPDLEQRGPRLEWAVGRRPEDVDLKKVLKPEDTDWQWSQHGYMRKIAGTGVPLRIKATTAYLQEIPGGSRSGKRWQMGDEMVYFLEGSGYSLHWDVAAEIDDQYYARVALEPTRWEWNKGDMMWIPQNTVFQHFNNDPSKPAKFLTAHNTAFEWLGYQEVDMEPCPEWEAKKPS
jgi:quercetin dioxygenase-like cupin family protein